MSVPDKAEVAAETFVGPRAEGLATNTTCEA